MNCHSFFTKLLSRTHIRLRKRELKARIEEITEKHGSIANSMLIMPGAQFVYPLHLSMKCYSHNNLSIFDNMNKRVNCLICFLIIQSTFYAQSPSIHWFDKVSLRSEIVDMLEPVMIEDNYILCVRLFRLHNVYNGYNPWHIVQVSATGIIEKDVEVEKDASGSKIDLLYLSETDNTLYGYYEVIEGKSNAVYRDIIDLQSLTFSGQAQMLFENTGANPYYKPSDSKLWTINGNAMLNFDQNDHLLLLHRQSHNVGDRPVIGLRLISSNMEEKAHHVVTLPGTNKITEIMVIDVDGEGNVYFITRDTDANPYSYSLTLIDKGGEARTHVLNVNGHIREIDVSLLDDQLVIAGLVGEKKCAGESNVFLLRFNKKSQSFSDVRIERTGENDCQDLIYCVSNAQTTLVVTREISSASSMSKDRPGTYMCGNLWISCYDATGKRISENTIYNIVTISQLANLFEGISFLSSDNAHHLIHNIYPDNIHATSNKELKSGYFLKKMRPELISIHHDGELSRKSISSVESEIVAIPPLTRQSTPGELLFIGEALKISNAFHFGIMKFE